MSKEYQVGVEEFIEFAKRNSEDNNTIRFPCKKCCNVAVLTFKEVQDHLMIHGIIISYKTLFFHGERVPTQDYIFDKSKKCHTTKMHDFPQEITHDDEHIVGHQYDNHNDDFATLLTNDTEVLENDDHNEETMVDDHMVEIVNDAYQYYNENPDVNSKNHQVESMAEKNDINQLLKLIEYAKAQLYPGCTSFTKLLTTMKLYNLKVRNGWSDASFT